jgi:zeta-carotene desaturase
VLSACNLPSARCEATHALKVFDEGMLAHRFAGAVGVAQVPLRQLYDETEAIVAASRGAVRLRTSAKALAFDGTRITGVVCDDGVVSGQAFIAAVPPDRLARLSSGTLRATDRRLAQLDAFSFSPILGIHLAFTRRVLDVPNLSLPGRGTHWLFAHEPPAGAAFAQRIEAVVSDAGAWDGLSESETTGRVLADMSWALGVSADALARSLAWSRPVLERHATFASAPGVDAIRPRATAEAGDLKGGVANLFLAGEWTDTGWPSTMEGAARSGFAAAAACTGGGRVLPDLPVATLCAIPSAASRSDVWVPIAHARSASLFGVFRLSCGLCHHRPSAGGVRLTVSRSLTEARRHSGTEAQWCSGRGEQTGRGTERIGTVCGPFRPGHPLGLGIR